MLRVSGGRASARRFRLPSAGLAGVAQLAERPSCKRQVSGSIPLTGSQVKFSEVCSENAMRLDSLPAGTRDRLAKARFTYGEVGATAGQLPAGYRHLARRAVVGQGHQVFAGAGDAVTSWQVQLRAGLTVSASAPTALPGTVFMLGLGVGPLRVSAPCRVAYVVDETRRRGFAYGTLPGHPESGEEAFIVEHHDDGTVTFTVTAFSRPSTAFARAAGPAGRLIQDWMTTRYLRSLGQ
jgi:uncharacterized protein (UPF0548 family)